MPARTRLGAPVQVEGAAAWDDIMLALPSPHLLQSSRWGEFKSHYGWEPHRLAWLDRDAQPVAAAQVLRRRWPSRRGPLSLLYCPRGPSMPVKDEVAAQAVLDGLSALAREPGVVMVKIEPDLDAGGDSEDRLRAGGWFRSDQPVQFSSTMVIDLSGSEDEILARMKPKTRYNVRLAQRRGVSVRAGTSDDLDLLYDMYAETSVRDGFVIRPRAYYRRAWDEFLAAGLAQPLVAEVEGIPVAGLIVYRFADRAWYLYGMSRDQHRERMPNHALQWAAIDWARRSGCAAYDLWGAPDEHDSSDPMWGVYRFKEGFGARHRRLVGSWELTSRPLAHRLYTTVLPRVLGWTRRRQQERTRQLVDPAG
jgi:peptidoglycan pentaglycine glycine transferase (the first glycine)